MGMYFITALVSPEEIYAKHIPDRPAALREAGVLSVTELNHWPKCQRCDKPVEYYHLQHKLEEQKVIVHASCHGKKEGKELGRMTAELMMGPLEMFGE